MRQHTVRFSLRTKLLVVSLSLLALPWAGYRYLNEMEGFLRQAQEQALLARAEAAAVVLSSRPEPFTQHAVRIAGVPEKHIYFVRSLETPVQLDGYTEEWRASLDLARIFEIGSGCRLEHLLAARGDELFALFKVKDDRIIYRDPRTGREGDHLIVRVEGRGRYLMSTAAPGRLNAYRLLPDGTPGKWEPALRGEWQESAEGYVIELRLPLRWGNRIGFTLMDVDVLGGDAEAIHTASREQPGVLLLPQSGIEQLVAGLAAEDSRAWVVDTAGRVLAVSGRLQPEDGSGRGNLADALFGLFIPNPAYDFSDALARASRLDGSEVIRALEGEAGTRRRTTADGEAVIASAAFPIRIDGAVVGSVVIEQTTNAILSVQNQAIKRLASSTLLALVLVVAVLLIFATRLSVRIRRLRDEADTAIGEDGRVNGSIGGSRARDEIGDLSRSFSHMLRRLGQYNRYLETMAGKLAHELRTPVVVVKSSLENLEHAPEEDRATYLQRARQGIDRLGTILQRLSEATRLEQALQDAELERFDLRGLVEAVGEGHRGAYPEQLFLIEPGSEPCTITAAPDLIAQMLDKLVSNAVDFARPDTPITIKLAHEEAFARLSVANRGEPLPENMRERLFESMVSVRKTKGDAPHLGLGLHIVRLVAEFHNGKVAAENHANEGVVFSVWLPLAE